MCVRGCVGYVRACRTMTNWGVCTAVESNDTHIQLICWNCKIPSEEKLKAVSLYQELHQSCKFGVS